MLYRLTIYVISILNLKSKVFILQLHQKILTAWMCWMYWLPQNFFPILCVNSNNLWTPITYRATRNVFMMRKYFRRVFFFYIQIEFCRKCIFDRRPCPEFASGAHFSAFTSAFYMYTTYRSAVGFMREPITAVYMYTPTQQYI